MPHTIEPHATQPAATPQSRPRRRALRGFATVATASAVALGSLLMAAGTASAKSEISVAVSAHVVRNGQWVRVTGTGGDDGMNVTYLCIDERAASSGWHVVGCNPHPYATVIVDFHSSQRGQALFRARLMGRHTAGGPLVEDRVSGNEVVTVR